MMKRFGVVFAVFLAVAAFVLTVPFALCGAELSQGNVAVIAIDDHNTADVFVEKFSSEPIQFELRLLVQPPAGEIHMLPGELKEYAMPAYAKKAHMRIRRPLDDPRIWVWEFRVGRECVACAMFPVMPSLPPPKKMP
jgi:hypothetical protein